MATKDTVEKTSDKELRRSERNKGDGASGKDDFSLPAPLQVKERLLAGEKTSIGRGDPVGQNSWRNGAIDS